MLGVPHASPLVLAALVAAGAVLVLGAWWLTGRQLPRTAEARAVTFALSAVLLALPYIGWRIVEDVRYTSGLDPYERSAAGPIQAFLPGYLVDGARRVIPPDETYATVVGDAVPNAIARKAFPALVTTTLFPRRSVAPRDAEWIVAWGTSPASVAHVGPIVVAERRLGPLPPVLVARVIR